MKPYLWAILTALTWGCVPLIEKVGLVKIDPIIGLFYRCMGVIIGITLLLMFRGQDIKASLSQLPVGAAFLVLGGFLASVVGQMFFYHALKSGEASRVVPISGAYPLITFVLGMLFLHEKITLAKAGGIACILTGVFLLK